MDKNKYDLSQYNEVDHEFVKDVENLQDGESIDLELQDMEGNNRLDADGNVESIPLDKEAAEFILYLMRKDSATFNEVFINILHSVLDEHEARNDVVILAANDPIVHQMHKKLPENLDS